MTLLTIGHSAHPMGTFLHLLQQHHVQRVVDVRSVPSSRFHPQFRKRELAEALQAQNIAYVFSGQKLGGRPTDPACYQDGFVPEIHAKPWPRPDYSLVMQRAWFIAGIQELIGYLRDSITVILCSEEDPRHCHRHLLIAAYFRQRYPQVEILHIRGDGRLEPDNALQNTAVPDRQLTLI